MSVDVIDNNFQRWLQPAMVEDDADRLEFYKGASAAAQEHLSGAVLPAVLAAHGRLDDEARQWLEARLADLEPGFIWDGRDELLKRIAAVSVCGRISSTDDTTAVLAALAVISARFAGMTAVIPELSAIAERRIGEMGRAARSRGSGDLPSFVAALGKLPAARKAPEGETVSPDQLASDLSAQTQAIKKLAAALDEGLLAATARLRSLDEEVEMLWWVMADTDSGGELWGEKTGLDRAVAAAAELAERTQTLPGPPSATGLLRRLLGKDAGEKVTVANLAEAASARPIDFGSAITHPLLPVASCAKLYGEFATEDDTDTWQRAANNRLDVDPRMEVTLNEGAIQVYCEIQLGRLLGR